MRFDSCSRKAKVPSLSPPIAGTGIHMVGNMSVIVVLLYVGSRDGTRRESSSRKAMIRARAVMTEILNSDVIQTFDSDRFTEMMNRCFNILIRARCG
jgi:hypothetical protein